MRAQLEAPKSGMAGGAASHERFELPQLFILDEKSVSRFLEPHELPHCYQRLPAAQQSDALRLALLARYGGVYTDVATLCLQPLEDFRPEDL